MPFNFGWVLEGRLAGMGCPHAGDWATLAGLGVRAVLSLTEAPPPGDPTRSGLVALHVPIPDFGTPSEEDLERCVRWVHARIAEGRPVVVHCHGGVGRTGMVLAACLVREGLGPEAAVRAVRARRPGSIETRAQLELVHRFAGRSPGEGGGT